MNTEESNFDVYLVLSVLFALYVYGGGDVLGLLQYIGSNLVVTINQFVGL